MTTTEHPLGLTRCPRCKAQSGMIDALCQRCTRILWDQLKKVDEGIAELEVQITRQNVGARQVGGGGGKKEQPLPYNAQASELLDLVIATLSPWTNAVVKRPLRWVSLSPAQKGRIMARALQEGVYLLKSEPGVEGLVEHLETLIDRIEATIDRQRHRQAIGLCKGCDAALMAFADDTGVECCGTTYDVQANRARLKSLAHDQWVTAKEAARMAMDEGAELNPNTIRSWVRRQKIAPRKPAGEEPDREARFRFGELLQLARKSDEG